MSITVQFIDSGVNGEDKCNCVSDKILIENPRKERSWFAVIRE